MKVLIIDDEKMVAEFVRLVLQEEGHTVNIAFDGREGSEMATLHEYDAIILDFEMPDCTGLEIVRALRKRGQLTPILMLTGIDSKENLIECLNAGADDYLVKPFSVGELRARVRALGRRGTTVRAEQIRFGDLMVDRLTHRVTVGERELSLTPKEYSLLDYLLSNPQRIVTRMELLEKVWEINFDPGSNLVDVHVARLRAKLQRAGSNASIGTVRGTGFILTNPTVSHPDGGGDS